MNITGDNADYIKTVVFNFASMQSEDVMGMVFNRTLYFIENWCILYEMELPEYFSPDLLCCFWRSKEDPGSFACDNIIIDRPDLFGIISNKLRVLESKNNEVIYRDENCLDDVQFDTLSKYRPSDGSMKYKINSSLKHASFAMINKGFFKLNKADKLSVVVYTAGFNRLLFQFILFKKKYNRFINIYLLTLDAH